MPPTSPFSTWKTRNLTGENGDELWIFGKDLRQRDRETVRFVDLPGSMRIFDPRRYEATSLGVIYQFESQRWKPIPISPTESLRALKTHANLSSGETVLLTDDQMHWYPVLAHEPGAPLTLIVEVNEAPPDTQSNARAVERDSAQRTAPYFYRGRRFFFRVLFSGQAIKDVRPLPFTISFDLRHRTHLDERRSILEIPNVYQPLTRLAFEVPGRGILYYSESATLFPDPSGRYNLEQQKKGVPSLNLLGLFPASGAPPVFIDLEAFEKRFVLSHLKTRDLFGFFMTVVGRKVYFAGKRSASTADPGAGEGRIGNLCTIQEFVIE